VDARDWLQWYEAYGDPSSNLARRLVEVRNQIKLMIASAAPGPIRVVSICAGDGRDLIGALVDHPRRSDVNAVLLELNPELVERGRASAWAGIEFITGDAASTGLYAGSVPADLVLICGVFGNISDDDIRQTIESMPQFCATGGAVIWTRHRREPDLVPTVCDWFEAAGFEREWLSSEQHRYGVGVHRYGGTPRPLITGRRLFRFVR
jgi:hypothetical protein